MEPKPIQIRGCTIGAGRPKIIVPIMGATLTQLEEEIRLAMDSPADLIEWRLDWFDDVFDCEALWAAALHLRALAETKPILATFRSAREGGHREITLEQYTALIGALAESTLVDLIDIEAYTNEDWVKDMVDLCHGTGVIVVLSSHDFEKTPPVQEMVRRLRYMQTLGGDIPKLAVMPRSAADVTALLQATQEMHERYADCPIITMSMGRLGRISRLAGETFGSAATFGTAGQASAPGQVEAEALQACLELLARP